MADKTYVAQAQIYFTGEEDWARGQAQWLVDNVASLMQQAALVDPGGAGERTSYAIRADVEEDGSLGDDRAGKYLDDAGQVVDGFPTDLDG